MLSTDRLSAEGLLTLARSSALGDRDRLLIAVAKLCSHTQDCSRPEMQALLGDIFMGLVVQAERDIRLRLAEMLARIAWSPHALIVALANDEIEIARPIIAQSPVLTDQDLVSLLANASIEHQIEVARRPHLTSEVVAAVMDKGEADVLAMLASNATADVSVLNLTRLVYCSGRIAALRAPLARHPNLTPELANLLYSWVGRALRDVLIERFPAHKAMLNRAVAAVVHDAHAASSGDARLDSDASSEQRLVQKLQAAGQLRAGLLIRALHEGKLTLFVTGLAALGALPYQDVVQAVDCDSVERLAAACSAAGIDRGAFPTVLNLVRNLNAGRPGGVDTRGRVGRREGDLPSDRPRFGV